MENSTRRTILVTVVIIIIIVSIVAYENPRYDLTLFLTAVASSLTANLIFDLVLRKESTLNQSAQLNQNPNNFFEQ